MKFQVFFEVIGFFIYGVGKWKKIKFYFDGQDYENLVYEKNNLKLCYELMMKSKILIIKF